MNNLISQTINFVRFPAILLIVFIHSGLNYPSCVFPNAGPILYKILWETIGNGISRIGVPLFYFISGYLFFVGVDKYTKDIYCKKLKKRIKSLLIPYVIFNYLAVFVFGIAQYFFPSMISGNNIPISQWRGFDWIYYPLWQYSSGPFVAPLWFVRNLFIVVIISPMIYFLIKKFHLWGIVPLGILWLVDFYCFSIPGTTCLFFFCLGAFFSIHNIDFVLISKRYKKYWLLYVPLLILNVYYCNTSWQIYVQHISILFGIPLLMYVSSCFVLKGYQISELCISSTFFIFIFHAPYIGTIIRLIIQYVPWWNITIFNDLFLCMLYLLLTFMYVAFLVFLYKILCDLFPKTMKVICGGR